ncbi:MAG: helix-turn-helix domain-containing protein, partial [Deltaproteobacteria bacterium]|nr:helix-turn-helix domain-containing protein [Deltaproteobacteria bacterium]
MKLTISDTAKLLAIPDATIKRWIHQGKIPVIEKRHEYFFIKKDIEKWAL